MIKKSLKKRKVAKKVETRTVGLDTFGNAIPEVPAAKVEGTGKALRVIENKEFEIRPGKRARRAPVVVKPSPKKVGLFSKVGGFFNRTDPAIQAQQEAHAEFVEDLSTRFEHAFKELKHEFVERERVLEEKLHMATERLTGPENKAPKNDVVVSKNNLWLKAGGSVIALVIVGYLLLVLTSMEGSISSMSGDMTAMNTTIGGMGEDTHNMSEGIQKLDGNMQYMNGNIAQMNGNMAHMNQNVGQMTRAVEPMGQAAQNVNPFLGAVRSFFPF